MAKCCCRHSVSKIVGLTSQFASQNQNCLGCYSKLNLDSKFHAEVATRLPHVKLRTPYTLILYCNNYYSIATNCVPVHHLSSNFHAKIAT